LELLLLLEGRTDDATSLAGLDEVFRLEAVTAQVVAPSVRFK
jgi:hypothetical protein